MTRFPGFPGRLDYVAIPKVFFSDLLPTSRTARSWR